jgi:hypothetical protein
LISGREGGRGRKYCDRHDFQNALQHVMHR